MKNCTKCLILKELSCFHSDKHTKDGFTKQCKDCRRKYQQTPERKLSKRLYAQTSSKIKLYQKEYQKTYKPSYNYQYKYKEPTEQSRQTRKEYRNKRKQTNINFKLATILRNRLYIAIRGNYKAGSAVKDLGCSISELRLYLESKFQPGMNWENYGKNGWHIDHIQPLGIFDLTNIEQFLKACHYTNLQPLWIKDHQKKTKEDRLKIKNYKDNLP